MVNNRWKELFVQFWINSFSENPRIFPKDPLTDKILHSRGFQFKWLRIKGIAAAWSLPPQRYYTTILNIIVLSKVRFGSEKRFKIQQGQISIATCGDQWTLVTKH